LGVNAVEKRRSSELRPHQKNVEIYGDEVEETFVENVRKCGILTPLLVTFDNRIISGHRRNKAAKRLTIHEVPIVVFPSQDEDDILEALILSNRDTRQRTPEQEGREFITLKDIARRREGKNKGGRPSQKQKPQVTSPTVSTVSVKPATRIGAGDIAARQLNISRQKGERAALAVQVMEKLEEGGKKLEAHQIRQQLKKNAGRAYRLAKELEPLTLPPEEKALVAVATGQAKYITLDHWQTLSEAEQRHVIASSPRNSKEGMNEQKTDNIEWAQWSWNPVTGCLHNCPYCYARDIAENLYPHQFAPAFNPGRLHAPRNTRVPDQAQTNIGYKNVFTCSMADLFGKWVPQEWIEAVLSVVRDCPQWNFLFLTKFPLRLAEFAFPDNAWVGTSVDCQARVANAEAAFRKVNASVKWLSCEPLLENLQFNSLSMFQWVVIGGASTSAQTPEFRPPRLWINNLWAQAREAGCKIYEKTNLLDRLREYPGQQDAMRPQDVTKEFHYALLSYED
jgi:protein gp37